MNKSSRAIRAVYRKPSNKSYQKRIHNGGVDNKDHKTHWWLISVLYQKLYYMPPHKTYDCHLSCGPCQCQYLHHSISDQILFLHAFQVSHLISYIPLGHGSTDGSGSLSNFPHGLYLLAYFRIFRSFTVIFCHYICKNPFQDFQVSLCLGFATMVFKNPIRGQRAYEDV